MISDEAQEDGAVINEIQLLLAEKRTALATMRTGIAVFALPLTVLSVLVATSKYYDVFHVMPLLLPLLALCGVLVVLGSGLVLRALVRLHHHDELIAKLKRRHSRIAEFID
jgi:uncharacterized membrane protein YidH (DUF202 family)